MVTQEDSGVCESCQKTFQYYLIHCGFNESAYAYCDACGCTLLIDLPFQEPGYRADLQAQGLVSRHTEKWLDRCSCGGRFKAGASPRCPHCKSELSPDTAAAYIERNAPGTPLGFRWQRSWSDIYSIIIQGHLVKIDYNAQRRA